MNKAGKDTAEFVGMILKGLGFVKFSVGASRPGHLAVAGEAANIEINRRVMAEGVAAVCSAASGFCPGDSSIVRIGAGSIEIRVPDAGTAAALLGFTEAFYASSAGTPTEFAHTYQSR